MRCVAARRVMTDTHSRADRLHQPDRPLQQAESSTPVRARTQRKLTPRSQFVLPEMIAHAFLTLLFLLFGQWLAFLLNVPLVAFNVNKWVAPLVRSRG